MADLLPMKHCEAQESMHSVIGLVIQKDLKSLETWAKTYWNKWDKCNWGKCEILYVGSKTQSFLWEMEFSLRSQI